MVKELLKALEKDARLTAKQLAVMLNQPESDIQSAIERLERERIILRYKTVVNWEKAGEELVSALIEVKVSPQRDVGFDAIAERIYRFSEARSVSLVSGTFDLAVQVTGRSMKDVAAFVAEKLAPLEGVQATITHFLLKRYKEDGDILDERPGVERLPIAP
jgi:DNA-binding Lrp family transcriptional regulator